MPVKGQIKQYPDGWPNGVPSARSRRQHPTVAHITYRLVTAGGEKEKQERGAVQRGNADELNELSSLPDNAASHDLIHG